MSTLTQFIWLNLMAWSIFNRQISIESYSWSLLIFVWVSMSWNNWKITFILRAICNRNELERSPLFGSWGEHKTRRCCFRLGQLGHIISPSTCDLAVADHCLVIVRALFNLNVKHEMKVFLHQHHHLAANVESSHRVWRVCVIWLGILKNLQELNTTHEL